MDYGIEKFNESFALCMLTRRPSDPWLELLMTFVDKYDVFVVMDEQADYSEFIQKYPKITFVQISDDVCTNSGYTHSDIVFKPIVATDRAFYYFNRVNTSYEHIWFIEDDVMFKDKNVFVEMDKEYTTTDMLCPPMNLCASPQSTTWPHIHMVGDTLQWPVGFGLVCCMRVSSRLMQKVDEFVVKHNRLNYKEFLFHTLAIHNNLHIIQAPELRTITWPTHVNPVELKRTYNQIHPPVKDFNEQIEIRNNA